LRAQTCYHNCLHFADGRCQIDSKIVPDVRPDSGCPYYEEQLEDIAEFALP